MIITIDGVPEPMQPDSLNWEPPRQLGTDGEGAPVRAPNWSCRLGFSRLTRVQFQNWFDHWDTGELVTLELPHPSSGVMTEYDCYVAAFVPRFDTRAKCEAAANGVDITLTRIQVA